MESAPGETPSPPTGAAPASPCRRRTTTPDCGTPRRLRAECEWIRSRAFPGASKRVTRTIHCFHGTTNPETTLLPRTANPCGLERSLNRTNRACPPIARLHRRRSSAGRLERRALIRDIRQCADHRFLLRCGSLANHRSRRFLRSAVRDQLGGNHRQIVQAHKNHQRVPAVANLAQSTADCRLLASCPVTTANEDANFLCVNGMPA